MRVGGLTFAKRFGIKVSLCVGRGSVTNRDVSCHVSQLLHLLLRLFSLSTSSPDLTSISQIYLQLSSLPTASSLAADTLNSLLSQGKKLEAYQVGFDLADAGGQEFRRLVVDGLKGDEVEGLEELKEILGGGKSIRLNLEFLSKNNHADLQILKNTKVSGLVTVITIQCG